MMADEHPDAFKRYISARSDIHNADGDVCFKRTWTRLLRRAVRDDFFRATGASETLKLWATVRDGEKKYISPFKYKADLLFDSSMEYEVPVMKQFALNAFNEIPENIRRKDELESLRPALLRFESMDASYVQHNSILREFIGGGTYLY
jgi:uridine kinase